MMRPSTFFFLTRRGVRNLGKHWAMTIACIASLSVCMTLNIFASLAEVKGREYILVTAGAGGNHNTAPCHIEDAVTAYRRVSRGS